MKKITVFICLLMTICLHTQAQCKAKNTAFQGGEVLNYRLFFNWKFVWVSAGTAKMTTQSNTDGGFKSHLITHSSKKIDKFFMMRDTLLSIMDKDLVPQYYRKAANEGGKYYVDQVWYNYQDGHTHLKQEYLNRNGEIKKKTYESNACIYDMMSMMQRARSFDASNYKVGEKIQFPMADGDEVEQVTLIYRGKKDFKMEDSRTKYHCLVFSFVEYEKNKENEIITFYITDDKNHLPVRLDLFLKFGTAKAFLCSAEGVRNPQTSIASE